MARNYELSTSKGVAVIGNNAAAIQAALTLAQMGIEVKLLSNLAALGANGNVSHVIDDSSIDRRYLWPLLLRTANHPKVTLYCNTEVESIEGKKDDFRIKVAQYPRYIYEELCTSCGRCQAECSVRVTSLLGGRKVTHSAIHTPLLGCQAVPSAYVIDKNGSAPCYMACPLGINVTGFVSLLSRGKTDKALALIGESAPLGGILGRVCKHPCEDSCSRAKLDSPVSIRALHRYAADNAPSGTVYQQKVPAGPRQERIAIVGSGPAGLTAAWELARRGYSPTVFEAHSVIGGMLATGIPRFRLPREVRERDIEAIKALGVDIRTGITVGRDLTFAYLRERGYRAFFLSIGAQHNNRLNVPGEELEGVVDCISLLTTLNLMRDTFVGRNTVVIGDGNSAVDSARATIRRNGGTVRMLSWTIPEEVTAASEEVEEALLERVSIEYCAIPVEILGMNGKVTGVRCQRTRLTEEIMPNGRHQPEPIPGTDFVIDADHVVVAIGQSPSTSQLGVEGLVVDIRSGSIKVNPLTLETNIRGVFAGGDCITGPNNVVSAMADGLKAAESIDRYLQGHDLEAGRSPEPAQVAEVDMEMIEALPYERATVPVIELSKRLDSFEETTIGLSAEAMQREAQRCLNCAMCSRCMECTRICQLGAVAHDDDIRYLQVGAQVILRFPDSDLAGNIAGQEAVEGIHILAGDGKLADEVIEAMAMAVEAAIEVKPDKILTEQAQQSAESKAALTYAALPSKPLPSSQRIGVFLCQCGGSISSVIDFKVAARELSDLAGVTCVQEIAQACTEDGGKQIARQVAEWQLDGIVLAACRCCNLEQICYSCTDRRRMTQQYLNQYVLTTATRAEFLNIREQCAWAHQDDPTGATLKAVQIISSGVTRIRTVLPVVLGAEPVLPSALIIGSGLADITAAKALASLGYQIELMARARLKQNWRRDDQSIAPILERLSLKDFKVKPWPDTLKLSGSPGRYEVLLGYGPRIECIATGAVLVDMEEMNKGKSPLSNGSGLLSRIISRESNSDLFRQTATGEASGIFLMPSSAKLPKTQVLQGLASAARVATYLEQTSISPRILAVTIDRKMCRGCGNCADVCPYIEMREQGNSTLYAYIDKTLCLGCGACVTSCPAGAITQPMQSDQHIILAMRSLLQPSRILSEV